MKNIPMFGAWMGAFAGAVILSLVGCGTPEEAAPDPDPATDTLVESPKPGPPPEPAIQVGEAHTRREFDELEKLTMVEWVVQADTEAYVGVVAAVYGNDSNPVVEACLRIQISKDEPMNIYIVDDALADPGWKPGDDGQIEKLTLPFRLKMR